MAFFVTIKKYCLFRVHPIFFWHDPVEHYMFLSIHDHNLSLLHLGHHIKN